VTRANAALAEQIEACAAKWQLDVKGADASRPPLVCVIEFVEALRKVASIMVEGRENFAPAGGLTERASPMTSATASPAGERGAGKGGGGGGGGGARRASAAAVAMHMRSRRDQMGFDDEHGDGEDWGMEDSE
jgi:hypothetical protein